MKIAELSDFLNDHLTFVFRAKKVASPIFTRRDGQQLRFRLK